MQKTKESRKAEVKMQDCHWSLYMEEFAREKQNQQNAVANYYSVYLVLFNSFVGPVHFLQGTNILP